MCGSALGSRGSATLSEEPVTQDHQAAELPAGKTQRLV